VAAAGGGILEAGRRHLMMIELWKRHPGGPLTLGDGSYFAWPAMTTVTQVGPKTTISTAIDPPKQEAGGIVPLQVANGPGAPEATQQPKRRQSQQQRFLDRDFNRFMKGVEKSMADQQLRLQDISCASDRAR